MKDVEAVKTAEDIRDVERLLRKHKGALYADLWRIGINLGLRISDLLAIKYDHLDMQRRTLSIVEGKTGKVKHMAINRTAAGVIAKRRETWPDDAYLFQVHSNRTTGTIKPVSRISVARAFAEVGEIMGIKLGTHSMRKSRGWAMYSDGVPIEMICKVLNHSAPSVTMTYLGITKQEIMQTYTDYEL